MAKPEGFTPAAFPAEPLTRGKWLAEKMAQVLNDEDVSDVRAHPKRQRWNPALDGASNVYCKVRHGHRGRAGRQTWLTKIHYKTI